MKEFFNKWWPTIDKVIDLMFFIGVAANTLICMYFHDWRQGTFWAVLWCVNLLSDIRGRLK